MHLYNFRVITTTSNFWCSLFLVKIDAVRVLALQKWKCWSTVWKEKCPRCPKFERAVADLWVSGVLWARFPDWVTDRRTTVSSQLCSPLFGAPSLGALGSCPSRLPLDPPLREGNVQGKCPQGNARFLIIRALHWTRLNLTKYSLIFIRLTSIYSI